MNDTTREVGSALGIALLGSMYSSGYQSSVDTAAAQLPAGAGHAVSESAAAGLQVAHQIGGDAGAQLAGAVRVAFMDGLGSALTIGAVVLVAAAALIFAIAPRRAAVATAAADADERDGAVDLVLTDA
jgi:hypothetical protein